MKKNHYSINIIGRFFCFLLLAFFSFQPNAYPAPSDYFDTVQKIYIGYYQRPADPGGLIYWAGRLDNAGGSFAEIIEAYANSAESQALYGTINSGNISNVVNGIYNALFGRPAEPEGLNYYVNGFNLGQFTPATIMLNVLYGAQNEDLQSVNNKLAAANLFTRTIDPELDGMNFQVTYAGDGDAIAGRNFLAFVTWNSWTVPTQDETTAYMKSNIADHSDPINGYLPPTPPAQSWIGTYTLSSFEIYYDNGLILKSTDNIITSYSGTWKIRSNLTTNQTIEINGTTFNLEATWKMNASTGQLEATTTAGLKTVMDVTTLGYVLTTNCYVTAYGGYREFDHWTKVSDSVAMVAKALKTVSDVQTVNIPEDETSSPDSQLGTLAGQLMEEGK
jgi:hypothetical protein